MGSNNPRRRMNVAGTYDLPFGHGRSLSSQWNSVVNAILGGWSSSWIFTYVSGDYLRFAQMLMDKGTFGDARILGRKTVEYMLSNQLAPDVKNLIANAYPTRADYGFGLGLAVRTTSGIVRMMGSVGDFSWPGATGTNWWADPQEELAVVWMAQTPGTIRWKYRQMINALVYQAIVD